MNEMAEQKEKTFGYYDAHVRSVTTLCHMLRVSGDATRPPGRNTEGENDPTVGILTNLAHSLRRHVLENVAVALDQPTSQVLVANSPSEGSSKSETYDQPKPEELSRGLYSTNTANAGATPLSSDNNTQDIPSESVSEMAYRYSQSLFAKNPRDPRHHPPLFPSHVKTVFRLFKDYLEAEKGSEEERRRIRDFQHYVLGMSLGKLHDAMKEPRWKFRTKGALEMRKFLCNEGSLSMISVPGSISIKEKTTDGFVHLLNDRGIFIDHQTDLDVKAKLFTRNVAIAFHGLLKSFFTQIQAELGNLRQTKSKTEFDPHLADLYRGLIGLMICTHQLKEMMYLYIKSLKIVETPSTPGPCDDNAVEDLEEEIEDKAWPDAFKTWIAGLLRQIRATCLLTSLCPSRKTQILKIDFTLIEQAPPDTSMEWWRTTIKGIYGEETVRSDRVCKALSTIASGNTPDDKTYQQLKRGDWTQSFQGAVHCEAMLAVTQCNSKNMYQQHFGVSHRCCVACTFLLEETARVRHGTIPSGPFYLGTSNKIWGIALPPGCPIVAAKEVSGRLDKELKGMLSMALPSLEARAEKYKSGGSQDERSGQEDEIAFERLHW